MPHYRVIVSCGDHRVGEHTLSGGVLTLGRHSNNTIVLDAPHVSRYHASLTLYGDGGCTLQDLGSRNGTRLRGERVHLAPLAPGDTFSIGSFTCKLELAEAEAPGESATRPDTAKIIQRDQELLDSQVSRLFVGRSEAARKLLALVKRAAGMPMGVLVTGESGSGKGVVARLLHDWGTRSAAPFITVNCAAIPPELVESHLFGHRKGSFTGAVSDQLGKFQAAHGGTLFLDEIGDLSLTAQAKILRAIEDGLIEPVGCPEPVSVDVSVVAATHRDLEAAARAGSFRQDLYFRLAALIIEVPPLRERPDDILLLAYCFLGQLAAEVPTARGSYLTEEALEVLTRHHWPGNVRELRNVVARSLVLKEGPAIEPGHLGLPLDQADAASPEASPLDRAEAREMRQALERHGWNQKRAAAALGIDRKTLRRRMERLGIQRPGARPSEGRR